MKCYGSVAICPSESDWIMNYLDRFHSLIPMSAVPGMPGVWAFEKQMPRHHRYCLEYPEEQVLFQVNVKREVDEAAVRPFLAFAAERLPELWCAPPMVAVGGLSVPGFEFDSAIAVLPVAAGLRTSGDAEVDSRIYGLFPGWGCEVAMTEGESRAHYRFRRALRYSDWNREPSPELAVSWDYKGRRPDRIRFEFAPADFNFVAFSLRRMTEAESGWVSCRDARGRIVRATYDEATGLVWDAGGTDRRVHLDEARTLLWSFVIGED